MRVNGFHDGGRVVRSCDREHGGMILLYESLSRPQTARDDNLAILRKRFPDRPERFFDGGVDEAAGVDDDEVGAGVVGRGGVALGAQLREDALGVDERFGTA